MGFFDRFGNKAAEPKPPPPADPPRDHGKPRPQHYELAHRALPIFAFRNSDTVLQQLAGDQCALFLDSLWRTVGKDVAARGLPTFDARFPPAVARKIHAGTVWLVACPPTATALEAAWVGVLQRSSPGPDGPIGYFTLEVGTRAAPRDPLYHVVCEWRHMGFPASPRQWTHRNWGLRSEPAPDAFAAAIEQALG